ncbi:MAG: hypothetical protein AAF514_10600 [Verrucomicrobiota bacterium]
MIVLTAFVWVLALSVLVMVLRDPKTANDKSHLRVKDGELFEPTREYPTLLPRESGGQLERSNENRSGKESDIGFSTRN